MSAIRIAYVIDNLDRGGTQTWFRFLTAGLARRGYGQHVFCLNGTFNPGLLADIRRNADQVEVIGRPRLYAGLGILGLWRDLRRLQPDLVVTILPYGDLLGRSVARAAGLRPVISSVQTRYHDKGRVHLWLDRITARWIDQAICVAGEIVPHVVAHEGIDPRKTIAIPNGVEIPELPDATERMARRREHGVADGQVLFGVAARLSPQKGLTDLLTAYAQVAATGQADTALWVIGDGPLRQALKRQARCQGIAGRVRFLGDRGDVLALLPALDVFVHPSLAEGMPHAVMEAMAAARPTIAAGVDGVAALIADGENGWTVPPRRPAILAERMLSVLAERAVWPEIGGRARQTIRARFTVERMVAAYDAAFRRMLGGEHVRGEP